MTSVTTLVSTISPNFRSNFWVVTSSIMSRTRKKPRLRATTVLARPRGGKTHPEPFSPPQGLSSEERFHQVENHHNLDPIMKQCCRATSHLTGFVVRYHERGCFLGYISQTDPRGKLPIWLVNKITQKFAPKVVKQLKKAAEGYESWKVSQKDPLRKPWIYPELTLLSAKISTNDVSFRRGVLTLLIFFYSVCQAILRT